MYEGHTIGVVVPAYDEAGFVRDVIESVPAYVDRVYAVDDRSTDDTFAEIQAAAETWADHDEGPTVVPIRHSENRGVGGAIKTGYQRAREDEVEVTVVMAGDGQMEVEIFERLLVPIVEGDADYVKANRFMSPGELDGMPELRRVGNRLLELLTRVASGYWSVGDPQSGYTAISLRALRAVDIDELYEFYGYCNELLVRMNVNDLRVVDVPRPVTYADEDSGIRLQSYVPRVSAMLLRNFLWRLRARYVDRGVRDVPALYGLGVVSGLAAVVRLLVARGRSSDARLNPLTLFAAALVSLFGAVLLDRARNDHLNDRDY
ncbi:glycosyltransferase family 2 protein [Haloarchaeobius sp. HRN-SO-5]|uniref:glycosyltransferase family 2 protein n=1 Tax=Haloarchaeobius sp. HRN-SO-5 TaxID=3446118 RepID=UPI003EC0C3BE